MKLLDIITSPWAITPDKLCEIRSIYETHMRGEKIDIKGIEARMGEPLGRKEQGYDLINGTAVIPIDGVIGKKMNLMSAISGGASTQLIERDFKEALNDPSVESILLDIDSPGGSVDGTQELASLIFESRGQKPITAFANGSMSSAAYWIGAAADRILISGETTSIGSIGVVATHVDYSKANKKQGVKPTEIVAGKFKRVSSENEPLSDEGKADIQDKVDYIYSIFVADIAKFRGVSEKTVLEDMADGRVFLGRQAIDAGLADGVSTFDSVIQAAGELSENIKKEAVMAEDKTITQTLIAEEHSGIAESFRKEGFEKGYAEGAKAEVERIQAVKAQSMSGHEALIETLMFDGKTTGPEAAVQVLNAERTNKDKMLKDMQADADLNVTASLGDGTGETKDFDLLVAEQVDAGKTKVEAIRAVVLANPESHKAYLKAQEAKNV